MSDETHRRRLRDTCYDPEKGTRWAANIIRSHGMRWLKPQEKEAEEIVELVWLEQFIAILPTEAQTWVLKHTPQTLEEAVGVMESFEAAERIKPKGSDLHGEIWKGGGGARTRPKREDQAPALTPSGRGGGMEATTYSQASGGHGPGATSTPKAGERAPRGAVAERGPPPWNKRPGICCFLCQGLLYREGKDPRTGEEMVQLVLPASRRAEALHLAHDSPLGGHMGEAATLARLLSTAYWPGIYRDVKEHCSTCPACQLTQPKGGVRGSYKPCPSRPYLLRE